MLRTGYWLVLSMAFAAAPALGAEPTLTAQQLIDMGAVRLPADDTRALLAAGAEVQLIAPGSGNVRKWVHGADGRFTATSIGSTGRATNASGQWRMLDNGQYCVEIAWNSGEEKWCRVVYRVGDATYVAPGDLASNADKRYGLLKVAGQAGGESGSQPAAATATAPTAATAPQTARPAAAGGAPQKQYLGKAELQELVAGKSMLFQRTAVTIQWDVRASGQLFGVNRSTGQRDAGSWSIGNDGGFCIKWRGGSRDACYYMFRNAGRLAMTESADPGAPVSADIIEIN